jgi:hypothetical protein
MLGATQAVDMISSLRNDFGRVKVPVLDVNLLPNAIDSVVIGDRLFTLPIQVEGRDDPAQDENMEVDNNNDGHEDESEKDDQLSENQEGPAKGKQTASSSKQLPPTKQGGEQMDEAPVVEDASDDEYNGHQVSKYPSSYCPSQIRNGIPFLSTEICESGGGAELDENETENISNIKILVGVNVENFDIADISQGDFYIKFRLRNKIDNFEWVLIAVYGAAQNEFNEGFLRELVHTISNEKNPVLVGGDFNIIRSPNEKNNERYDNHWPFLFNAIINSLDLRELQLSGRQFTWAKQSANTDL